MKRVLLVGLALAVAVAIAAAVRPSSADCAVPTEADRTLNLQDAADRRHLESDLDRIRGIAQRYREEARKIPLRSESIDARRGYVLRPERAYAYCVAILTEKLAATHHLDEAQLEVR